jgi:hypothetical protein
LARAQQSLARASQTLTGLSGLLIGVVIFAPLLLAAEPLKVDVTFSGLWWAQDQVDGMNPDHPPPKTTRVRFQEWNAEDNQWPPHPDVVDVDVAVSGAGTTTKAPVEIDYQYDVGGHLSPPKQLVKTDIDLPPGQSISLHGAIKVMDYLRKDHRPDFLKVTVKIAGQPTTTAQLSFVLGD